MTRPAFLDRGRSRRAAARASVPTGGDPPADVETLLRECSALSVAGRHREAAVVARRILEIDPEDDRGALALAFALSSRPNGVEDLQEALRAARRVIARHPGWPEPPYVLAAVSLQLGLPGGRSLLDAALALMPPDHPNYPEARVCDAAMRLHSGDLGAWADYYRFVGLLPSRRLLPGLPWPRWEGEDLAGRKILLTNRPDGEGDCLMAARFIPRLAAKGAVVRIMCPDRLLHLLAHVEGVDTVMTPDAHVPPDVARLDFWSPIWAIPGLLGVTLETIPTAPYLASSSEAIERWRPIIDAIPGRLRVGVCWQGNPDLATDAFRSFRLEDLAPLAEIPGVALVSLQKGHGAEQLAGAPFPIHDLGPGYAAGDWMDTAAVVIGLDLVVSPDTGVAHLAGGMGKPTWLALARPSEWRWMDDREDSPWYPTLRLFRQDRLGQWAPVFRRMGVALAREASR